MEIAAPWVLGTSPRMTLRATLPAAGGVTYPGRRRRQGAKGAWRERRISARATTAARKASLSSCHQLGRDRQRQRSDRPSAYRRRSLQLSSSRTYLSTCCDVGRTDLDNRNCCALGPRDEPRMTPGATFFAATGESSLGRRRRQGAKGARRELRLSARAKTAARKASLSSCQMLGATLFAAKRPGPKGPRALWRGRQLAQHRPHAKLLSARVTGIFIEYTRKPASATA